MLKALFLGALLILSACHSPEQKMTLDYTSTSFSALPGWSTDNTLHALPAMRSSCQTLLTQDSNKAYAGPRGGEGKLVDWHPFCQAVKTYANNHKGTDDKAWRQLLITYLTPYKLAISGNSQGKFTGYYEPILKGSRTRHGPYQTPLYRFPTSKNININLPRSAIVKGALKGKGLELVWVDDAVEAFFLQIQGSGRVILENGEVLRIGYAGTNRHPYHPIGKTLVEKGFLKLEEISMQSIRSWLKAHPNQAETVMSENQSYVFFRILEKEGPIGSQGIALTPMRSMAVDPYYISLGTPLWVDIHHPDPQQNKLQHLMIAQDTGGAIKGGLRGDYFWGAGNLPAEYAGKMNSIGEYYVLLPRV